MAKEQVFEGPPNSSISHAGKFLGRYDDEGHFVTDDEDTIRRMKMVEKEREEAESGTLGERLAEQHRRDKYKEHRKIAEAMVDVLVERGLVVAASSTKKGASKQ